MGQVETFASPSALAVIACGDLRTDDVMKKLRYMSYMIPASDPVSGTILSSQHQSEVTFEVQDDDVVGLATVAALWSAPRTPVSLMNTVQTAVYETTVHEMGAIVCSRVRKTLRDSCIPVAEVLFRHVGSLELVSDEIFRFEVTVRDTSVADAVVPRAHLVVQADRDVEELVYGIGHRKTPDVKRKSARPSGAFLTYQCLRRVGT
jgi:hypothetical protein